MDCRVVLPPSAHPWEMRVRYSSGSGRACRKRYPIAPGELRDSLRFQSDLAQLPRRRGDLTAEIKAWRVGRLPRHQRHSMPVEHAFQARHQLAQIRAEAGCKNDRVEFSAFPIGEHDAIGREAVNAAAYFDLSVSDFVQRADIDQGYAPVLLDHLPRPLGGAAQSQFFDSTDREPQDRRVDRIDQTRGQAPV